MCHSEPGPEPCPETSSGSIEFDLRFRNLEFSNDNKSIAFALLILQAFQRITLLPGIFSKVILDCDNFSLANFLKGLGKDSIYEKYLLNTAQLCWADENRFAKR
jgi:hypothetical protein